MTLKVISRSFHSRSLEMLDFDTFVPCFLLETSKNLKRNIFQDQLTEKFKERVDSTQYIHIFGSIASILNM